MYRASPLFRYSFATLPQFLRKSSATPSQLFRNFFASLAQLRHQPVPRVNAWVKCDETVRRTALMRRA